MPTRSLTVLVALAFLVVSCLPHLRGTVERDRLHAIVDRDAILFDPAAIPEAMIDRLAGHRVVVVGEYHDVTHHDAFVGELAVALRPHGFGLVLLEFPQAESWLLDAYVRGAFDTLLPGAKRTYGDLLDRIRAANAQLPPADRIRVAAIDVNPSVEAFLPAFRGLLHQIALPEPLTRLVATLEAGGNAAAAVAAAQDEVEANADAYRAAWGDPFYQAVSDALDGEARSAAVRREQGAARDRSREAAMHALVDRQLATTSGATVVNVGLYHAQKRRGDGTVDVWLAERLLTESSLDVFALAVAPAKGEMVIRGRLRTFDVADESPANELFRAMQEVAGGAVAFLALDDPLFAEERVMVNFHPQLRSEPPAEVFDGFVLLPEVGYDGP